LQRLRLNRTHVITVHPQALGNVIQAMVVTPIKREPQTQNELLIVGQLHQALRDAIEIRACGSQWSLHGSSCWIKRLRCRVRAISIADDFFVFQFISGR